MSTVLRFGVFEIKMFLLNLRNQLDPLINYYCEIILTFKAWLPKPEFPMVTLGLPLTKLTIAGERGSACLVRGTD